MTVIYGIKTCDTCRTALKALPDARFVDLRQEGISEALVDAAIAQFGDKMVNKSSKTWRDLNEDERAQSPKSLISQNPTIMKRPLIQWPDNSLTLAWTPDIQRRALGQ